MKYLNETATTIQSGDGGILGSQALLLSELMG